MKTDFVSFFEIPRNINRNKVSSNRIKPSESCGIISGSYIIAKKFMLKSLERDPKNHNGFYLKVKF